MSKMQCVYTSDDAKWTAFETRDAGAVGHFVCAVKTTRIYCHPHCAARPLRKNVMFYADAPAAERAGFRACKRCKPDLKVAPKRQVNFAVVSTGMGHVAVAATTKGICAIELVDSPTKAKAVLQKRFSDADIGADMPLPAEWRAALAAMMDTGTADATLPFDPQGTPFQHRVWNALKKVRSGKTISHSALARRLGKPRSARAVAQACARNPLAVAVPCHRVVRADGALGGYRWGMERKQMLLAREAAR